MKTGNKIDDLFREAMDGYQIEPSISMWKRIEQRYFPPSRFNPSGLITSGILIFIAGLMPWVLIPANGGQPRLTEPQPPGTTRGYILNPTDNSSRNVAANERTYAVQTTYLKENKGTSDMAKAQTGDQDYLADPSVFYLADAHPENVYPASRQDDIEETAIRDTYWYLRMHAQSAGLMDERFPGLIEATLLRPSLPSAFTDNYESDYFRNSELSLGGSFNPSVVFYNPNPTNKMLGGEINARYKVSNWYFQGGLGYSRMEDIGSYKVNYKSKDSVGYFINVISFTPDPRNPGNIQYTTRQETIYDSVEHYDIKDKTNHYSYLDVPVSIGYTFFNQGRLTFSVNAGVKFSVLLAKDEPTVLFNVPNGELIDIERQVPSRMGTNWRFTAGLDFGYLLTSRVSLHLEPVFEQYITPIYMDQQGIKPKKPSVTGLKAGFRYTF